MIQLDRTDTFPASAEGLAQLTLLQAFEEVRLQQLQDLYEVHGTDALLGVVETQEDKVRCLREAWAAWVSKQDTTKEHLWMEWNDLLNAIDHDSGHAAAQEHLETYNRLHF